MTGEAVVWEAIPEVGKRSLRIRKARWPPSLIWGWRVTDCMGGE